MNQPIKGPKLDLSSTESSIINVLRSYTDYFNETQTSPTQQPLTLRVTGGWVRDKLLNQPTKDIDIGIDHLSGETFVMGLKEFLDEKENEAHISKIHKIKKNPDKSKHLETCTTHLFGLDIDFVNLRSETYTSDSRIPKISAGTPLEDAHRRDATLNSLFYNLSTLEVEDWTGRGLEDLKNGVLRTPLEPTKTFLDDPLRCLRLIRFASTYGFTIDPETLNAMRQPDIKDSLDHKISRERIGIEIKKMMMSGDTILAFKLLKEVGFGNVWGVGDTPISNEWLSTSLNGEEKTLESLNDIVDKFPIVKKATNGALSEIIDDLISKDNTDELEKISFYSSLVLAHWGSEKVKCAGKKGREGYVAFWCVLNGIKMPMKMSELVALIVSHRAEYTDKVDDFYNGAQLLRSDFAKKFILPYSYHWELNLVVNYVLDCFEFMDSIETIKKKYQSLYDKLYDLHLHKVYEEPLLIKGKELLQILDRKPGPWLRSVNDKLFDWQLDHPTCTKEEMIDYLHTCV
ncbi:tRNA adenylyltransferase [Martiniozyma asiatica (nom. inval.)]|nr:tRNA adenylyltransferase [Martiniozyma asiatica]